MFVLRRPQIIYPLIKFTEVCIISLVMVHRFQDSDDEKDQNLYKVIINRVLSTFRKKIKFVIYFNAKRGRVRRINDARTCTEISAFCQEETTSANQWRPLSDSDTTIFLHHFNFTNKKKRKLRRLPFFYFLVSFIFLDFAYSVSVREGGKCSQYLLFIGTIGGT